jgi:hypothetical protein
MFPIKQRKEALATPKDVPTRTPPRTGPTDTPAAMATRQALANGRGHCSFRSVCVPAPLGHNHCQLIWGQSPSQAWSEPERWTGILRLIDLC